MALAQIPTRWRQFCYRQRTALLLHSMNSFLDSPADRNPRKGAAGYPWTRTMAQPAAGRGAPRVMAAEAANRKGKGSLLIPLTSTASEGPYRQVPSGSAVRSASAAQGAPYAPARPSNQKPSRLRRHPCTAVGRRESKGAAPGSLFIFFLPLQNLQTFPTPAFSALFTQNPAQTPHIYGGTYSLRAPGTLFDNRIPRAIRTPTDGPQTWGWCATLCQNVPAQQRATSNARPMLRAFPSHLGGYRSKPLFPRATSSATCCAPPCLQCNPSRTTLAHRS